MMLLSQKQMNAVKYYQGDVSGNDPFWGDQKAYCTLNSLFFPGIENETARSHEGKKLNPAFLDDTDRLIGFCDDLLSAFCTSPLETDMISWRVERISDYRLRKAFGNTISFTSTSTTGFLNAYGDKKGLALIKFELPAGTPCIDLATALDTYTKSEEAEVLLPPGLVLALEEIPLTNEMRAIRDADNAPPIVACIARPCGLHIPNDRCSGQLCETGAQAGKRIYTALNNRQLPTDSDAQAFIQWKRIFRSIVLARFAEHMAGL